jgi:hypothetical protein
MNFHLSSMGVCPQETDTTPSYYIAEHAPKASGSGPPPREQWSTTGNTKSSRMPAATALPDATRSLPCDDEAEQGVLSCFLHEPALLMDAQTCLPDVSFHHPANRLLYTVLKDFHEGGRRPVEYIALTGYLRDRGQLDGIGGAGMLSELLNFIPTPTHYGYYKRRLKDKLELRDLITACTEAVNRAYEPHEDVRQFTSEMYGRFALLEHAQELTEDDGCSIVDLEAYEPDPEENLLGDGWLRRGGAAIFVGPSGIGKSSASMQQDIAWALGREAFGITPARPLRILTIQSENDRADLHEMSCGVLAHFGVTEEDRKILKANTCYRTWTKVRGAAFLSELRNAVRKFKPDLVRVDPLQGFAGCKIEDSEQIGNFLRAGLTPVLEEYGCGLIIAHHTPKPRQDTRTDRTALDFAYAGAGGAEITNWARAILAIEPKGTDIFAYHAAKRGKRIGWEDPFGYAEFTRYFRHARDPDAMHWEEVTDTGEIAAALSCGKKDLPAAILLHIPSAEPISRRALVDAASVYAKVGKNKMAETLRDMLDAKEPKVFAWKVPRPRTNPMTMIFTSPQPETPLLPRATSCHTALPQAEVDEPDPF